MDSRTYIGQNPDKIEILREDRWIKDEISPLDNYTIATIFILKDEMNIESLFVTYVNNKIKRLVGLNWIEQPSLRSMITPSFSVFSKGVIIHALSMPYHPLFGPKHIKR